MRYHAAIFDFDGTLVDTLDDLADSMNAVLEDFSFPVHPVEPYRYFVGRGMFNLARAAAPDGTPEDTLKKMAVRMGERYGSNWANKTRPYQGIPEVLKDLRGRGMGLAILSNKPDVFTKAMANHFFAEGTFDAVMGATEAIPIKPDPEGALLLAKRFGMDPGSFVYLGDTNTDMKTGLAAGMFTVGVTWGFRPVEELREAGAQAIIDAPDELPKLLWG